MSHLLLQNFRRTFVKKTGVPQVEKLKYTGAQGKCVVTVVVAVIVVFVALMRISQGKVRHPVRKSHAKS